MATDELGTLYSSYGILIVKLLQAWKGVASLGIGVGWGEEVNGEEQKSFNYETYGGLSFFAFVLITFTNILVKNNKHRLA